MGKSVVKRASQGRRKIEIVKIKKYNNRRVTFSKRRSGLFKKASELCTLCGVEIGIIIFSTVGKVFSFGHPNIDSIMNRFYQIHHVEDARDVMMHARQDTIVQELNMELEKVTTQLEMEKKRSEALGNMRVAGMEAFWWEAPIDDLGFDELQELKIHLIELRCSVAKRSNTLNLVNGTMPFYQFDEAALDC